MSILAVTVARLLAPRAVWVQGGQRFPYRKAIDMVVIGIILVILAWAVPQIFPSAPAPIPALEHIGWVVGWILIVIGLILWLLGRFTSVRYTNGRRHLY